LCLGFKVLFVVVGWSLGGGPLVVGRWSENRGPLLFYWLFGVGWPLDVGRWALLVGRWPENPS